MNGYSHEPEADARKKHLIQIEFLLSNGKLAPRLLEFLRDSCGLRDVTTTLEVLEYMARRGFLDGCFLRALLLNFPALWGRVGELDAALRSYLTSAHGELKERDERLAGLDGLAAFVERLRRRRRERRVLAVVLAGASASAGAGAYAWSRPREWRGSDSGLSPVVSGKIEHNPRDVVTVQFLRGKGVCQAANSSACVRELCDADTRAVTTVLRDEFKRAAQPVHDIMMMEDPESPLGSSITMQLALEYDLQGPVVSLSATRHQPHEWLDNKRLHVDELPEGCVGPLASEVTGWITKMYSDHLKETPPLATIQAAPLRLPPRSVLGSPPPRDVIKLTLFH